MAEVAIGWFGLYPFFGGLDVFWKTSTRKLVSTAVLFGKVVPFMIMFAR